MSTIFWFFFCCCFEFSLLLFITLNVVHVISHMLKPIHFIYKNSNNVELWKEIKSAQLDRPNRAFGCMLVWRFGTMIDNWVQWGTCIKILLATTTTTTRTTAANQQTHVE